MCAIMGAALWTRLFWNVCGASSRRWKLRATSKAVRFLPRSFTAIDGDYFSYFFRKYKLGTLIGTRTWGGVRGIRGYIPLMDGGYITRPEFSLYNLQSQWVIENHGVQPDIVVDDLPGQLMEGHDAQLEKAIQILMQEIQAHPKRLPPRPPDLPPYPPGPAR